MTYKAPFYSVKKALYAALSNSDIGIEWFDASVPIEEIEQQFKEQEEFAYGIFGASNADCESIKDTIIWNMNINLQIYSNYSGSKVISQKLEELLNFFCSDAGWESMQNVLTPEEFKLLSISCGALSVNMPIYSDVGVWQSGSTNVTFKVNQI